MSDERDMVVGSDSNQSIQDKHDYFHLKQSDIDMQSNEDPEIGKLCTGSSTNIEDNLLPSTSTRENESGHLPVSNSSGPSQEVLNENHSMVLEKVVTYKRIVFDDNDLSPDDSSQCRSPENNFSFVNSEASESDCSDIEESPVVYYHLLSQCFFKECSKNNIKRLADNWKTSFKVAPDKATKVVMDLILHTAGAKTNLRLNEAVNMSTASDELIHSMIDEKMTDPDSPERPVLNDDYLERVSFFLTNALKTDSVLLNQHFMNNIYHLMQLMIQSSFSTVRFTATILGAIMIRRLIKFQEKLARTDDEDEEAALPNTGKYVMSWFFKYIDVMLMSLRDVETFIRVFTLDLLSKWFSLWPYLFVKDYFLRHVTLLLFDVKPSVATAAIRICQQLITSDNLIRKLDVFINRSVLLLMKRTQDSSTSTASAAIRAVAAIARKVPDISKYGSCDKVLLQIFYNRPKVAFEAAGFFYNMLEKYHSEPQAFIREVVKFLLKIEVHFDATCEDALVCSLFRHAPNQLTDWRAWRTLILALPLQEKHQLVETALRLLASVVRYVNTLAEIPKLTSYPPVPSNDDNNKELPGGNKSKKVKGVAKKVLEDMTLELGSHFVPMMQKHKHRSNCILPLLEIAENFLNVDQINLKKICIYLIAFPKKSTLEMDQFTKTLSCLHNAMKGSPKWKKEVPSFEKSLLYTISRDFPTLCKKLAAYDDKAVEVETVRGKLEIAMYLSKYFDLSSTPIPENALIAMKFGIEKEKEFLINCCALICVNQAKWQLYNMSGEKHLDTEIQSYLIEFVKLRSFVDDVNSLLEPLLQHRSTFVRDCAFSMLCSILGIFNANNIHAKPFTPLHLPRPSILVTEWLNFYFVQMVPVDQLPSKDDFAFSAAISVLSKYVGLIVGEVLPISYLSSVLPLFRFYLLERNYNDELKNLMPVVEAKNFPSWLVNSLSMLHKLRPQFEIEIVATGFCTVVLKKIKPAHICSDVTVKVLNEGLNLVEQEKDLSFLLALSPFARIATKAKLIQMKTRAEEYFSQQMEDNYVCKFISAFGQYTPNLGFSSSQESCRTTQTTSSPQ